MSESSLQQRRSHAKSRNGCKNCKQRHVKCDEQGPPCANCAIRNIHCVYATPLKAKKTKARLAPYPSSLGQNQNQNQSQSPVSVQPPESSSSSSEDSQQIHHAKRAAPSAASPPTSSQYDSPSPLSIVPATSPAAFSSTQSTNRLLELELMHRWSLRTWAGFRSIPDCQPYLQYSLTATALGTDYLMSGILALAAADAAMYGGSQASSRTYTRLTLEYGNRASRQMRAVINDVNKDNLWMLCTFSLFIGCLHMSLPPMALDSPDSTSSSDHGGGGGSGRTADNDRARHQIRSQGPGQALRLSRDRRYPRLAQVCSGLPLIMGYNEIMRVNFEWLVDSPTSVSALLEKYPFDLGLFYSLDPDTRTAIERMSTVSKTVRLPPTGDPSLDVVMTTTAEDGTTVTGSTTQGPIAADVWGYKVAVGQTKYSFGEDKAGRIQGYFVSAINAGGTVFTHGCQEREPVALFVLMYWAVLMDRTGKDGTWWWIRSLGKDLVGEISELLSEDPISVLEDVKEGIAWTRKQVGLAPLPGFESVDDVVVSDLGTLRLAEQGRV